MKSTLLRTIQKSVSSPLQLLSPWWSRLSFKQLAMGSNNPKPFQGDDDTFHRFTAGRWLFDEQKQLAARYVSFNMVELSKQAAGAAGSKLCVDIQKLPEGQFNKVFLMTMDDGKQVVAKVPNPNAGRPHYTTASEVATMDFVRNVLKVPVPKVLAWSSCAAKDSVGAEYIIMEKVEGVELGPKWESLKWAEQSALVQSLVKYEHAFASCSFSKYGSLYYREDIPEHVSKGPCVEGNLGDQNVDRFAVGPTTDRKFYEWGRSRVDVNRGPWNTAEEYVEAIGQRELDCIQRLKKHPKPDDLCGYPGGYQPSMTRKVSALQKYLQMAKCLLPSDSLLSRPSLWHTDMHGENILVHPDKPTEISGIIDWQSVHIAPLFLQVCHPNLIEFDGPKTEGWVKPSLPENFDELSPAEQKKAKTLKAKQAAFKFYEVVTGLKNKLTLNAMEYKGSLPSQVIVMAGHVLKGAEVGLSARLLELEREWATIVGPEGPPCPVETSEEEQQELAEDLRKWAEGADLMNQCYMSMGAETGWDGFVEAESYESARQTIDTIFPQFVAYQAKSEEEKAAWAEVWPFQDSHPDTPIR